MFAKPVPRTLCKSNEYEGSFVSLVHRWTASDLESSNRSRLNLARTVSGKSAHIGVNVIIDHGEHLIRGVLREWPRAEVSRKVQSIAMVSVSLVRSLPQQAMGASTSTWRPRSEADLQDTDIFRVGMLQKPHLGKSYKAHYAMTTFDRRRTDCSDEPLPVPRPMIAPA